MSGVEPGPFILFTVAIFVAVTVALIAICASQLKCPAGWLQWSKLENPADLAIVGARKAWTALPDKWAKMVWLVLDQPASAPDRRAVSIVKFGS
jgi:hypothetical protein